MAQGQPKNTDPGPTGSSVGQNVLTFLAILGILIALWLIVILKPIVLLIVISIVFACGLAPAVGWLERVRLPRGKRFPRVVAILLIYVFALIIALGAATAIIVPVVQQSIVFSQHVPEYIASVEGWLAGLHAKYSWVPDYPGLLEKARAQASTIGTYLLGSVGAAFGIFGGFVSVFTVLIVTLYLLLDSAAIKKSFLSLMPPRHEKKAKQTVELMAATVGGWLRGQLLLAGIIGLLIAVGMALLGVPYYAVIAVVGAIAEMIPMVGPIAAAVPALLLVVFEPTWKIVLVIAFFLVLVFVESNILAPRIMSRQLGMSPLVTILALIIGGSLLGIVGALLAIPVAAALQVLFVEVIAPAIRKSEGRKE